MKEGKQRLFACKAIPLDRRVAIFRSHVLSAVTPGIGTWRVLNGREWQVFLRWSAQPLSPAFVLVH